MMEASADERSNIVPMTSNLSALADTPLSPEICRQIYVGLDLPEIGGPVIGITSAIAGEGRSTVAAGLAHTLATDLDTTVLLVDADLVRPSLAGRLGIPASPGLPEVLRGRISLEEAMQRVSERLFVVTSDSTEDDGAQLLRQLSEHDLFQNVRARGTLTILDLPPVLNHSYLSLAAAATDALVLVIRAGVTPTDMVREAVERLKGRPLQGAVLNAEQPARKPRRAGRKRK